MQQAAIERLLPAIFQVTAQPGTPLAGLLGAMEQLHAPDEEVLADFPRYLDPYRAPTEFVPFLAHWVDLGWLVPAGAANGGFGPGLGRLRNLIAIAPQLSRLRGTAEGLVLFLETASGVRGFEVHDRGPLAAHLVVTVPEGAADHGTLIRRIVDTERPAHATFEIAGAVPDDGRAPEVHNPDGQGGSQ